MFDRFTEPARTAIVEAQAEANERGDRHLGCEHLLLGLAREGSGRAASALASRSITIDSLRGALDELVGPPPASVSAAESLATIGIDLGNVRARLEENFGADALAPPPVPFDEGAKEALHAALAEAAPAAPAEHPTVDTEHELIGVAEVRDGMAGKVLAHLGVDVPALIAELRASA